ncbi:MAG: hypothetical protein LWW93_08450 [Hyphomicrobiales bacterium]|nr:hypothetical protein [Hyphomicrobiales bacterium]
MAPLRDRLTRRALLVGLVATPLSGCVEGGLRGSLGLEPKLPRRRFRALRIDAAPMAKKGVPNWAARIAAAVKAAAEPAFADMIDPSDRKAPALTLEIDACDFPIWRALHDVPFGDFGADDDSDWIVGHVVYGAVRRRVAVTSDARAAGAQYLPGVDQRRIDRLAAIFAGWARREFED